MKSYNRNIIVLCAAGCFLAIGFLMGDAAAQTKKPLAKATAPTAKSQKSPVKTAATKSADKSKSPAKSVVPPPTTKAKQPTTSKSPVKSKTASTPKTNAAIGANVKNAVAKSPTKSVSNAKSSAAKTSKPATIAAVKTTSNSKPTTKAAAPKITTAIPEPSKRASVSRIIVAATSARVRSEPNAGASTVSTVNVGKIFPVLEENSIWYRVRLADDKSGWISKQIAVNFEDARREDIYRKIVNKYFKSKMNFANAAEIFVFLTEAIGEIKGADAQADFGFKRLQALSAALAAIPDGGSEGNPHKDFLKTNEKEIVYSEPSGKWSVRSDVFWETHAKYKDSAVGEEIAWAAAQTALPGECEGYVNCYIYLLRVTDGEYLNFYPNGKYARKSIENITSLLTPIVADLKTKAVYTAATDISDRAEFNRLLTELRTIISKAPFVEKAKPIQQITQIGEGFR